MTQPFINLTEKQIFTAVRAFLLSTTLAPIDVIKGQVNRVAEPAGADFVVMTLLNQKRLATNLVFTYDDVLTGSIAGPVLTVTSFAHQAGPLLAGTLLRDNPQVLAANTVLGTQTSGTTGGTGTYNVSPSQVVSSETMYAGLRADILAAELNIQIDIHGPNSLNNSMTIDTLFRSEVGVDDFNAQGFDVTPLYCSDSRQMPFTNEAQQYEDRWVMELAMQISPIINTPQEFATQIHMGLIEVDTAYA